MVGVLCIFFHLCWCCEGCLSDGSQDVKPKIKDMKATALKDRWVVATDCQLLPLLLLVPLRLLDSIASSIVLTMIIRYTGIGHADTSHLTL